jgi:proteasome lid subunit RPN8/RPN11
MDDEEEEDIDILGDDDVPDHEPVVAVTHLLAAEAAAVAAAATTPKPITALESEHDNSAAKDRVRPTLARKRAALPPLAIPASTSRHVGVGKSSLDGWGQMAKHGEGAYHQQRQEDSDDSEPSPLDMDSISAAERAGCPEFFRGHRYKTPARYLHIRNHIIALWKARQPEPVTKTSVRTSLRHAGDVNAIGRIHGLLEHIGAINTASQTGEKVNPTTCSSAKSTSEALPVSSTAFSQDALQHSSDFSPLEMNPITSTVLRQSDSSDECVTARSNVIGDSSASAQPAPLWLPGPRKRPLGPVADAAPKTSLPMREKRMQKQEPSNPDRSRRKRRVRDTDTGRWVDESDVEGQTIDHDAEAFSAAFRASASAQLSAQVEHLRRFVHSPGTALVPRLPASPQSRRVRVQATPSSTRSPRATPTSTFALIPSRSLFIPAVTEDKRHRPVRSLNPQGLQQALPRSITASRDMRRSLSSESSPQSRHELAVQNVHRVSRRLHSTNHAEDEQQRRSPLPASAALQQTIPLPSPTSSLLSWSLSSSPSSLHSSANSPRPFALASAARDVSESSGGSASDYMSSVEDLDFIMESLYNSDSPDDQPNEMHDRSVLQDSSQVSQDRTVVRRESRAPNHPSVKSESAVLAQPEQRDIAAGPIETCAGASSSVPEASVSAIPRSAYSFASAPCVPMLPVVDNIKTENAHISIVDRNLEQPWLYDQRRARQEASQQEEPAENKDHGRDNRGSPEKMSGHMDTGSAADNGACEKRTYGECKDDVGHRHGVTADDIDMDPGRPLSPHFTALDDLAAPELRVNAAVLLSQDGAVLPASVPLSAQHSAAFLHVPQSGHGQIDAKAVVVGKHSWNGTLRALTLRSPTHSEDVSRAAHIYASFAHRGVDTHAHAGNGGAGSDTDSPDSSDLHLVSCVLVERQQQFTIRLSTDCLALMQFHASLTELEVIGLLGGRFDAKQRVLTIECATPCPSRSTPYQCEIEADVVPGIVDGFREQGLEAVGWYHSHPQFVAEPSVRDMINQEMYQRTCAPVDDDVPFVAMIVHPARNILEEDSVEVDHPLPFEEKSSEPCSRVEHCSHDLQTSKVSHDGEVTCFLVHVVDNEAAHVGLAVSARLREDSAACLVRQTDERVLEGLRVPVRYEMTCFSGRLTSAFLHTCRDLLVSAAITFTRPSGVDTSCSPMPEIDVALWQRGLDRLLLALRAFWPDVDGRDVCQRLQLEDPSQPAHAISPANS